MQHSAIKFLRLVKNPLKFRMFLLYRLPSAFFSGLKVKAADENSCTVSVPFKWLTQNPFGSTYFASLAMAAEMSTGVFAMMYSYKRNPGLSMLVTRMEANYFKKAVSPTFFTCTDGKQVHDIVEEAILSGEAKTIQVRSIGTNSNGEKIAEFYFTWSFKSRVAAV
ncbi:MAG: DUF4442 domain-containing protein [Ginsengibacter sp.]